MHADRGEWPYLAKLFGFGDAVPIGLLEKSDRSISIVELERLGLVVVDEKMVRAMFQIELVNGRLVVCDWPVWHQHENFVQGVTNPGRILARLTPQRPVGRILDLGTGCGLQTVIAAQHALEVVATDLNPRAVEIARAGAWLNGATNVDVREGSWFAPVEGELFDLVVCNPPYVISPDRRLLYRDGGDVGGEELCAFLADAISSALAPEGVGIMLANWSRRTEEDWSVHPTQWLQSVRGDRIVIRYEDIAPDNYARLWNLAASEGTVNIEAEAQRWIEHYERLEIANFYFGALLLHRAASSVHDADQLIVESAVHEPGDQAGAHLERMFSGCTWSAGYDLPEILHEVPHLVPGHEVLQRLRFLDQGYVADEAWFDVPTGTGVGTAVEPQYLAALLSIDGTKSIEQLASAYWAEYEGSSPDETEASAVATFVSTIRELARSGIISFVNEADFNNRSNYADEVG